MNEFLAAILGPLIQQLQGQQGQRNPNQAQTQTSDAGPLFENLRFGPGPLQFGGGANSPVGAPRGFGPGGIQQLIQRGLSNPKTGFGRGRPLPGGPRANIPTLATMRSRNLGPQPGLMPFNNLQTQMMFQSPDVQRWMGQRAAGVGTPRGVQPFSANMNGQGVTGRVNLQPLRQTPLNSGTLSY